MVYEIRTYDTKEDFYEQESNGVIAFETDKKLPETDIKFCGKLLWYWSEENEIKIPDGIETIGYSFLINLQWDQCESGVETVYIPTTVTGIEEGAFVGSYVTRIEIHPDSPCGIVKDGGLYTKDGKTLLWTLCANEDGRFTVADGTERIGTESIGYDSLYNSVYGESLYTEIIIPASVKEIGYNENSDNLAWDEVTIKAPKGSYAIEFAKEHEINFEEV